MSLKLLLDNLVAYSLQVGLLVGLAAFVPSLLRLRQPGAKLIYWHLLLAACLLLPLQPWKQVVLGGSVQVTTVITAINPVPHSRGFTIPRTEIALLVLAAGALIRLIWLAAGFWKLRLYRRRSRPLEPAPAWSVEASLHLSDDVSSPVTFGWRKPVVLLPAAFPRMDPRIQEAILCHEVMHVRRGDWLFTVLEEVVRAILWFHPAIWWLLGEIGLAREQEVDRLSIEITRAREEYMDALLAIAGGHGRLDLAPAPLFLRKRHLKQRVILILKESGMSKTRLFPAFAAGMVLLAASCWLVSGAFPLMAAPQVVTDAAGVTVAMNGATVLHRTAVPYPSGALQSGIEGNVSLEVKLDAKGNVNDARVLSGPEELRRTALQAVLQWHFTSDAANSTRVVQIGFALPKNLKPIEAVSAPGQTIVVAGGPTPGVVQGVVGGVPGGVIGGVQGSVRRDVPGSFGGGVMGGIIGPANAPPIRKIMVYGLSEASRLELLSKLPIHEGETLTPEANQRLVQALRDFDEHLSTHTAIVPEASGTSVDVVISAPNSGQVQPMPSRIKVGGNVQNVNVISKVAPIYPQLAKSARVSGVVHLAAIIGKDGAVVELHSLGGPALLIQAAMDAVKQWMYQPTLLNGQPVQVETTIDVTFSLNEQ